MPQQKRQLAAIMFTDIVGYTSLMQQSEERAVKMRDAHRRIFKSAHEKYQGKIIQYYGDGTLSIFNSAVQAVLCACEMQLTFRKEADIPVRIGIHQGDIILEENDIIGDAVNLAARVESLGVAGNVLITDKVLQEIYNKELFKVESLGKFQFKNDHLEREVYAVIRDGLVIPRPNDLSDKPLSGDRFNKRLKGEFSKKKVRIWIAAGIFIVIAVFTTMGVHRIKKMQWARNEAIPEIERIMESMNVTSLRGGTGPEVWQAYQILEEAENYIKNDPAVQRLTEDLTQQVNFQSEPSGAKVWARSYAASDGNWKYLGVTPIQHLRFPYGASRIRVQKDGWADTEDVIINLHKTDSVINITLHKKEEIPAGMVWAEGDTFLIDGKKYGLDDFFADKYEVTNEAFKAFVDANGYQNRDYWQFPFISQDDTLSWEDANKFMVDQTGLPGPSTWVMGSYAEGEADYPVGGISWYEAAAYAAFAGKALPTVYHSLCLQLPGHVVSEVVSLSNFNGTNSVQVGSLGGIHRFGVHDLGGNVREWLYNGNVNAPGKLIIGGGWDDFPYMVGHSEFTQDPMNRHMTNGFRCIQYFGDDSIDKKLLQEYNSMYMNADDGRPPVSDQEFSELVEQFEYDHTPFNEKKEYTREEPDWTRHKITFDPAYLGQRMILYLFTPKFAQPPYQTIIYYPGGNAKMDYSSEKFLQVMQVEFLLKTGRAVAFPIYKGFYERGTGGWISEPNLAREEMIQRFKDLLRSVDYLYSRQDIDTTNLGFYGISLGGAHGGVVLALEKRIKAAVLVVAGLGPYSEEIDRVQNYLPRVKVPVLMLNGELDHIFPYETSQKPFYELLGTAEPHKKLITYPNGHLLPKNELIKESLSWFDEYLGPVEKGEKQVVN